MAKVLLTYDVKKTSDTIHKELKDELINTYKYSDAVAMQGGGTSLLPNTTLSHSNKTREQSEKDFFAACLKVKATWEKFLSVEYDVARVANNR